MSNGKGGKKKILMTIVTIIIVLVVSIFGLDVSNILETENQVQNELPVVETPKVEAPSEVSGELIITMIDVGQADSFFFQQNEKTMLVDCGTRSSGDDVVAYLKKREDYLKK